MGGPYGKHVNAVGLICGKLIVPDPARKGTDANRSAPKGPVVK
jgi:hypothetical protein